VALSPEAFDCIDIAMFDVPDEVSEVWAPIAAERGAVAVDNSGAFRMNDQVPLVVPEVNPEMASQRPLGIISNPNCTTLTMMAAMGAMHHKWQLTELVVSSYQAVSGTGAQAIEELEKQTREWAKSERKWDDVRLAPEHVNVYPHQIAFNALPHVDSFLDSGYTKEEMKMENEGRKIMHHDKFRASVTCVRVPVFRAHSVAVSAEFEKPITVEAAREVLRRAPGLDLVDDPTLKQYPLALNVAGHDNCAVGRLRMDCALDNGLAFWVAGDQLLKGAALNAVQIAECL
jgi:aspartate-semialdehyde dehydrogenase